MSVQARAHHDADVLLHFGLRHAAASVTDGDGLLGLVDSYHDWSFRRSVVIELEILGNK